MSSISFGSTAKRAAGVAALVACLLLGACGHGEPSAPAAAAQTASTLAAAADPKVEKIYEHTCRNCHAVPASGAPQAGDSKAWAPRVAQGRDVLLDHSINGFKAMPPMGTCTQCTEKDFTALIEYMSGTQLK